MLYVLCIVNVINLYFMLFYYLKFASNAKNHYFCFFVQHRTKNDNVIDNFNAV